MREHSRPTIKQLKDAQRTLFPGAHRDTADPETRMRMERAAQSTKKPAGEQPAGVSDSQFPEPGSKGSSYESYRQKRRVSRPN